MAGETLPASADVVVIGAGPGGYVAAIRAAQAGLDVTLVERDAYGGTCLNVGCIPSKAIITAADTAHEAESAERMGIHGDVDVDFGGMMAWKDQVVSQLSGGVEKLCRANGVTLVDGTATFAGDGSVRVTREGRDPGTIAFEHAVVATGSRPIALPGFEFDGDRILSSTGALELEARPDRLVVVGAGYIGMELSTAFAKLGTDVTVVEALDGALPGFERDVARVVERRAEDLGVTFGFGERATSHSAASGGVRLVTETEDGDRSEYEADHAVVAVGRAPVTDTVDLEAAGIETDDRGFVPTDERGRTEAEGIFAVGDVAGEPMLAHKASAEGEIAADTVAGRSVRSKRSIPAAVFTDPEIATVGLTEAEAREAGIDPAVGRMSMRASGRALTLGATDGFVRIVADAETGTVLGAAMVCPDASELIAEIALAVETEATLTEVAATVHTHPTLGEAVAEAVANARGEAIHTLNE